jgi:predicted nucleotidyltransferase
VRDLEIVKAGGKTMVAIARNNDILHFLHFLRTAMRKRKTGMVTGVLAALLLWDARRE